MTTFTLYEWQEEGERRFGADQSAWRFACRACGGIAAIADYTLARVAPRRIARHCLHCGRQPSALDVRLVDDDMSVDFILPFAEVH